MSKTVNTYFPKGIGDVDSKEKGSGARYNTGKVEFHLIPFAALESCARVFMYGRDKYAAWNWAKGMDWMIPYDCLMRHMQAWQEGEDDDPESKLPHLGHAMCNLIMLTFYAKFYRRGDSRPPKELFHVEEDKESLGDIMRDKGFDDCPKN